MPESAAPPEVFYELDDQGRDSGVEREDVGEDLILEPFDPRLIDVTTETRTLDSLMKRLSAGQIDLDPDFQRSRGIWSASKKSQLIESLLLRIPLPTFYVAEIADEKAGLGDDRWAVVDGIQRLSTIAQFVAPGALNQEPLRLHGMQYLEKEEGRLFDQLSSALQLRMLESQFTMQIIRKATPEAVKLNIFARINTGGVPLSQQELRHALTPGTARSTLRDLAQSDAFQKAIAGSVSPSRMADREMVLRFLAFRLHDPLTYTAQDFDNFLRSVMTSINHWSAREQKSRRSEFELVMRTSTEIFGNDAFRKRYRRSDPRRPISKALFEAVAVGIATAVDQHGESAARKMVGRKASIKREFMKVMADPAFDRAISQGTGNPPRVRERFGAMIKLMDAAVVGPIR